MVVCGGDTSLEVEVLVEVGIGFLEGGEFAHKYSYALVNNVTEVVRIETSLLEHRMTPMKTY